MVRYRVIYQSSDSTRYRTWLFETRPAIYSLGSARALCAPELHGLSIKILCMRSWSLLTVPQCKADAQLVSEQV
jgi:hypothetical protein